MKNRTFFLLAALFAGGSLTAQDATSMWQFAPADAKAFIGIRWNNIEGSQVGRAVRQQIADAGFGGMPFFSLLKDIDEVVIVSPGKRADDPDDKKAPVLMRVTGRFRAGEFERMLGVMGAHAQSYRQKRVFRQRKNGDMAVTLVDDKTFLLGDAPSVFAALDRMEWPNPTANALLGRATKLRSENDIWAVFAVAPTELAGRFMADLPLIDDARGLDLGISLRTGLDLKLGLDFESEESAATMATALQKTLKLAVKSMQQGAERSKNADIAAAARKVQVAADKSSVRLSLRLDAGEVERSLAQVASRRRAVQPTVAATIPARPTPPPPPPQKQSIHIEGLDDGPKDVPLGR